MWRRVRSYLCKRQVDRDLDDELRSCVDLLAEERAHKGASPPEARRTALVELGGIEQVKEEVRAVRGLPALESAMRDLRLALRSLLHAPGFSIAVVLTLGVALGANCAVFALLDRLVLRPLPVEEPDRLVVVAAPPFLVSSGGGPMIGFKNVSGVGGISYPLYVALRDRLTVFAGMLAHVPVTANVLAGGEPAVAKGSGVTGNYFDLLGVRAALGRLLTAKDDATAGSNPVMVLTYGFWQRQFGGDPAVLNRTIRLDGVPMTVVGVTAQGFAGTVAGNAPDFFVPLCMLTQPMLRVATPNFRFDARNLYAYYLIARLAPGMDLKRAEQAADVVGQQLLAERMAEESPAGLDFLKRHSKEFHVRLFPGGYVSSDQSALSRDLRTPLLLLMGMVGLVLAIAAGNVANLFLARGEARSREVAIRFALGASRWRVLRALLVESMLLAFLAGAVGLFLARGVANLVPVVLNLERLPDGVTSAPDYRTGLFAWGLSLAAGLGIWAVSSLRVLRGPIPLALAEQTRGGGRLAALHWRRVLVVAQAALSILLLCSAAALSRSLIQLMSVDPGFPVEDLYGFSLNRDPAGSNRAGSGALFTGMLDQLGQMPGVRRVSITTQLPLSSPAGRAALTRDLASAGDAKVTVGADIAETGPGFFANLGIAVIAGREFTADDIRGGARVAVLNESLSRQLFGKDDPIGRRVGLAEGGPPDIRVVGVVRDTQPSPRVPASPRLYRAYNLQNPFRESASFVLRATTGVRLTREMVRAVVRRIEPSMAIHEFSSMSGQAAQLLYRDRMLAWVSLCFAALAAALSAIGIFGLTSFSVTKRAREIGVRIALGATRRSIQWMVMREVSLLAALGCAFGLMAFLASSRVLSSVLFRMAPSDPASLVVGVAVLAGTAFWAGFLPAYRAARLDPARTLRQD